MSSLPLPALLGGPPVRPHGPPSWPVADESVRAALEAAYADGSWGKYHGPHVQRLEERLAAYHNLPYALTCGSGTFAVELALRALKIGPEDEVLLPAYDYGGNFLCVHAIGSRPVLVDVAPDNWNIAPEVIRAAAGPATKAVVVSHLHGGLVPMKAVMEVAAQHGLVVIEDAAQATGAMIEGRRAGSWGDVGILSFGGSKLLTAGRGGAILTLHADVHQRARVFLHRGNHICPLSEMQAAVLLPQLEKLDERTAHRRRNVSLLQTRMRDIPGWCFFGDPLTDTMPAYYKVGAQFDAHRFGLSRSRLIETMRAEGIAIDEGFRALHVGRSPNRFRKVGELTEADRAHRQCLVLHHPVLLEDESAIENVALAVRKAHGHAEQLRDTHLVNRSNES